MSTLSLNYDWRKAAAASAVDDAAVEQAFMDQAYVAVQNKCGPLMRPPHQIGFEIVHKNDAATRMVAMFGFRAGRQLFYVPVFFLNGQIKGVDLMYRHVTKTFVPNQERWVHYLIANARAEIGRGYPRSESQRTPDGMKLELLANPTFGSRGKWASTEEYTEEDLEDPEDLVEDPSWTTELGVGMSPAPSESDDEAEEVKEASRRFLHEDWEQWLNEFPTVDELHTKFATSTGSDLKQFILTTGLPSVQKLASLIDRSVEFSRALTSTFEDDIWMPAELLSTPKKASAQEPKAEVVLSIKFQGGENLYKYGFVIDDKRQETHLNPVYADAEVELTRLDGPGKWDVLMADGTYEPMLVFRQSAHYELGRALNGDDESYALVGGNGYCDPDRTRLVLVQTDTARNSDDRMITDLYGNQLEDASRLARESALVEKPETGKAYRAVDIKTWEASEPFLVRDISTRDSITRVTILQASYEPQPRFFVLNPDAPYNNIRAGVCNPDMRFVEVAFSRGGHNAPERLQFSQDLNIGNAATVDTWICTHAPVKSASVQEDGNTGQYTVRYDKQVRRGLSKMAAAVALCRDLKISGPETLGILDSVHEAEDKRCAFKVWSKTAAQLQLRDQEDFQTFQDPDFGIPMEQPQGFALETQWNGPTGEDPRMGDAWDPGMGQKVQNADGLGDEALLSLRPEEIAQLAQQGDMPGVFEQGVIGTLIKTFDAGALLKSYLPKLEDAVDSLGRALFLFYLKPGDYERAYGADDMTQLESQFLSNFTSLGDLLLELLQKSTDSSNPERKLQN